MGYAKNPDDFSRRVVDELFAVLPSDLSLREIGRRSGIDHSQLSRLRDYKRMLDVDQLESLCVVANIAPHVIVERAEMRVTAGTNVVNFPGNKGMSAAASSISSNQEEQRAAFGSDIDAEFDAHENQP